MKDGLIMKDGLVIIESYVVYGSNKQHIAFTWTILRRFG